MQLSTEYIRCVPPASSEPALYWVMSADEFSLDINNPDEPKILCIGNNPDVGTKFDRSSEAITEETGDSRNQIHRYMAAQLRASMSSSCSSRTSSIFRLPAADCRALCAALRSADDLVGKKKRMIPFIY